MEDINMSIIDKTIKTEPQQDFLMIDDETRIAARRDLNHSGFKMYLWLMSKEEDFNLTKQEFTKVFNVSSSSYEKAWKELRDKGYMVKDGDIYHICEMPRN